MQKINTILNNKLKSTFIFSFLIYILLNSFVLFQRAQSKQEIEKFDLDKNGFIDNNEITSEYKLELRKFTSDTGMNLAPITLIPVSLVFGSLLFLVITFFRKRIFVKGKQDILELENMNPSQRKIRNNK